MKLIPSLTISTALLLPIQLSNAVTVATPTGGNISNHQVAPINGAPWNNVLKVSTSSGVYLGGGWMLTAEHVHDNASPTVVTYNGVDYLEDLAHTLVIQQAITGDTDLVLFRLETNIVALPTISIGSVVTDDDLTLIGRGGGVKQWGTNNVELLAQTFSVESNITTGFTTDYDSTTVGEGHLVGGDSGGGAFHKNGANWEVAGIMSAVNNSTTPETGFHIQLDIYQSQIEKHIATEGSAPVPEPSSTALMGIAACGLLLRRKRA